MNLMTATAKNRPAFFNSPFAAFFNDDFFTRDQAAFVPSVNIAEDEKGFYLEVSAPGFEKTDFKVKLENNLLTVSGEHKQEEAKEEKKYSRREFRYGSFARSFRIDEKKVETEGISARYENGVLHIGIPKKEIAKKEASIEIRID